MKVIIKQADHSEKQDGRYVNTEEYELINN